MAGAGADILVAHAGLTTSGTIGAQTAMTLDEAVEFAQKIADAGRRVNSDVIVLCHGGPIAEPEDAAYVMRHTRCVDGFFGASSIERLPVEQAITNQVKAFKKMLQSSKVSGS